MSHARYRTHRLNDYMFRTHAHATQLLQWCNFREILID
jgi:hypothetical protein